MRRRDAVAALGSVAAAGVGFDIRGRAQSSTRTLRIGLLVTSTDRSSSSFVRFRAKLSELGYEEGRNLEIIHKLTQGKLDLTTQLAAELVAQRPDVIVAATSPPVRALLSLTQSIPIVMIAVSDPVGAGFIRSLSRPSGNATGVSNSNLELSVKQAELTLELIPNAKQVGCIWNSAITASHPLFDAIAAYFQTKGIRYHSVPISGPEDYEKAIADAVASQRTDALIAVSEGMAFAYRKTVAEAALRNKVPLIAIYREEVQAGALAGYGTNLPEMFNRAALFVDRIARGADPATLPVEYPTRYALAINAKTAATLGVDVPVQILARADEVVD